MASLIWGSLKMNKFNLIWIIGLMSLIMIPLGLAQTVFPVTCYNRTYETTGNLDCYKAFDGINTTASYNYYSSHTTNNAVPANVTFYFNQSYTFTNWSIHGQWNTASTVDIKDFTVLVSTNNLTWTSCGRWNGGFNATDSTWNYFSANNTCTGSSFMVNMTNCGTYSCYINEINFTATAPVPSYAMNLSFVAPTNVTDTLFNISSFVFNVSANATNQNVSNITIFVYNSSNALVNNFTRFINTTDTTFLNATWAGIPDGLYFYNATAYGSMDTNASTSTYNFTIDTTAPAITNLNFTTNITYFGAIRGSFNLSDAHLYSFNISIDGVTLANLTNIVPTYYVYNLSLNASNYSVGRHNLTIAANDGHTAKAIKDYAILRQGNNVLQLQNDKNKIEIYSPDTDDILTTKKEFDRYTFDFKPKNKQNEYWFQVRTNERAYIIDRPESEYKEWIVSGNNWIDFMSEDIEASQTKIFYNNPEHTELIVTVKVKNEKAKYSFKSVGNLNTNVVSYAFYTSNMSVSYTTPIYELTNNTITLRVNTTNTTLSSSDVNATIIYNGSTYSTNQTVNGSILLYNYNFFSPNVSSDQLINFTWNITARDQNYSLTLNQSILNINITIGNCTNATLLNFTTFYEDYPTNVFTADYEYLVTYWTNPLSSSPNISINGTLYGPFLAICSPFNSTIYYDAYIRYSVAGGYKHRYYLFLETFNGTTKNVKGGNYNTTTGVSQLNLVVRDKNNYETLTNIVAILKRRYIGEDIYREVQWDKSDDYGSLLFNIKEADTDYKIGFYNTSNSLIKETNDLKFLCDSGRCDLTYLLSLEEEVNKSNTLFNYSFNNATGILNVTWQDPTLLTSSIRLFVTLETSLNTTVICNTSVVGVTGSTGCNMSGYNGTFLIKLYSSASPEKPKMSFFITRDLSAKLRNYISEKEGIFISFILSLVIVLGAIILGPIAAIVGAIIGLIVNYYIGITAVISLTMIIVAAIMGLIIGLKVRY